MAWSSPTLLGSGSGSSAATSQTITGITASIGDLVAVSGAAFTATAAANITMTDSAGNTYTPALRTKTNANNINCWIFFCVLTAALAGGTITVTGTNNLINWRMGAVKFTGQAASSPEDVGARASLNNGGTTTPTVTSGTPATAGQLFLAATAGSNGSAVTYTEDATWTNLYSGSTPQVAPWGFAYFIQPGSGAATHSPTLGTSVNTTDLIISFKVGGGNVYNETVSDTLTATDTVSAQLAASSAITDALTATDAYTTTAQFSRTVTDGLTAADIFVSQAIRPASVADVLTATDLFSSLVNSANSLSDGLTATDTFSAGGGNVYNVSMADALTAADLFSTTAIFPRSVVDGLTATDQFGGQINAASSLADVLTATDLFSAKAIFACSFSDALAAADIFQCTAQLNLFVADALTATDVFDANAVVPRATKCNTLSGAPRVRRLEGPARVRKLGGRACD